MINNKLTIEFMSKLSASNSGTKAADNNSKTLNTGFEEILKNNMAKTPVKSSFELADTKKATDNYRPENTKSQNVKKDESESKPEVKSYRDIRAQQKDAEQPDKTDKSERTYREVRNDKEKVEKVQDKPKAETSKEDAVVNSLASVMGMKPEELEKLLSSLNIKPEDLTDPAKTNQVVDKLAGVMKLDTQEKSVLADLIKLANEKADELTGNQAKNQATASGDKQVSLNDASDKKHDGVKSMEIKAKEFEKVDLRATDAINSMNSFKAKLQELTVKMQQNPQEFMKQMAEEMTTAITPEDTSNTEVKTTEKPKEEIVQEADKPNQEQEVKENKPADNKAGDSNLDKGTDSQKGNIGSNELKVLNQVESKPGEENNTPVNNFAVEMNTKSDAVATAAKAQKTVNVPKNEILNQVVEKAKVVLNQDKSEMVMDLKPDNLGKLSLKVVTERGIVVAKFIAENQQVKEALETNMQLLKDTLEKQGMTVQGFSVSVRQDSQKGFNNQWETGANKKSGETSKESNSGIGMVNGTVSTDMEQKVRAYGWSSSQINLTA